MLRRIDWKYLLMMVITIVAIIVAPYLSRYVENNSKSMSAFVLSQVALQPTNKEAVQGIQLLLEGVPLSEPFLSAIQFSNDGEKPITVSDFEAPLEVRSLSKASLVRARVTEESPENIGAKISWDRQTVRLKPLLLNPKDKITISIITSGGQPQFSTVARIAGISSIQLSDATRHTLGWWEMWKLLLAAFLLTTAATAVINPIERFREKKLPVNFHSRMVELNLLITGVIATFLTVAFLDKAGYLTFLNYIGLDIAIFVLASLFALVLNRMPLFNDGLVAINNKEKVMLETFKVGDEVKELLGKQTMTVVNTEADGSIMCAWFKNGIKLSDTFAPSALKKHTPQFGTIKVTGL